MKEKPKYTQIKTIKQLKKFATDGLDCFIALNGGARSSKHIWLDGKQFEVINHIDDTEQCLSEKELWTESNIGEALDKGALYKDN